MVRASKYDISPSGGVASLRESLAPPVRFLGFWTAVVSPFFLLGFVTSGLAAEYPLVLAGLFVANVAGLVLGSGHKR